MLFVSHEWVGGHHPDPNFEQFRVLKSVLKKLLDGGEVWSGLPHFLRHKLVTRERDWSSKLHNAVIWYDFFSIPQKTGYADEENEDNNVSQCDAKLSDLSTSADDNKCFGLGEKNSGLVLPAEAPIRKSAHFVSRRKYTTADFANAIQSIPSYVETAAIFMVLAPSIQSSADESKVHSFSSWYLISNFHFLKNFNEIFSFDQNQTSNVLCSE